MSVVNRTFYRNKTSTLHKICEEKHNAEQWTWESKTWKAKCIVIVEKKKRNK